MVGTKMGNQAYRDHRLPIDVIETSPQSQYRIHQPNIILLMATQSMNNNQRLTML
jgi:hypothetical protein